MVNNDYCAMLGSFASAHTFQLGDAVTQPGTEAVFRDLSARLRRLDPKLQ